MKFAKYGLATALMLAAGAFALPGKAEAGSGVSIRVPGFSLYVDDGHRHYRHRHHYERRYYRGRHYYYGGRRYYGPRHHAKRYRERDNWYHSQ